MSIFYSKTFMKDMAKFQIKASVTVLKKDATSYSETRTMVIPVRSMVIALAKYHLKLLHEGRKNDRIGLINIDFLEAKKI